MITPGSLINSKAIDVLFLSPPDIPFNKDPPTKVSMHFSSLRFLTSVSILFFLSYAGIFNLRAATYSRVYLTVRLCSKTSYCIT